MRRMREREGEGARSGFVSHPRPSCFEGCAAPEPFEGAALSSPPLPFHARGSVRPRARDRAAAGQARKASRRGRERLAQKTRGLVCLSVHMIHDNDSSGHQQRAAPLSRRLRAGAGAARRERGRPAPTARSVFYLHVRYAAGWQPLCLTAHTAVTQRFSRTTRPGPSVPPAPAPLS